MSDIKQILKVNKISIAEVAEVTGMTRQAVHKMINVGNPRVKTLVRFIDALNCILINRGSNKSIPYIDFFNKDSEVRRRLEKSFL